ncbi:hypothetical protein ASG67_03185 [Sphingomonas sp. Leaf339]|uniref:hypothetical protein n=1 Tax=Sphingomonas sp. Leaf339 TaxID=1736343 RepID=UPI0006F47A72|nr:hypothetical protein [Sphingomonas sp. Leaf339]KQU62143.1 hypothetical protein ASG67_03185 [Sphingomonas sp. Leaf339]
MTAAYRLKGIGWFGGCVAIVLGFYLVSLQVAGERKKLEQVNRRITVAERDIRALETEFDTRANLAQLEKWNGDTLALSAPTAGQFISDEAQLASLDVTAPMGGAMVRTAALVVPTGAAPLLPAAMTLVAANTPPPVAAPAVQRVIATVAIAPTRSTEMSVARRAAVAAVAKVRPDAVALLDRKLLSDTTLGDILSGARAEAGRKR